MSSGATDDRTPGIQCLTMTTTSPVSSGIGHARDHFSPMFDQTMVTAVV